MAIDRHDNGSADDGSFNGEGRDGRPDQGRAETPDHRAVPERDRPVAEEERDRAGLYADMRAEAAAEASGDGRRAEEPEARYGQSPDNESRDNPAQETGARDEAIEHGPRPPDRDAPRITDDGGWEWKGLRLGPEANRIADDAIAARRSAEGRDRQGRYGDDGITPAMRRVEAGLEHGSLVPDTEKFALKGPDRFKEKLAKLVTRYPDHSTDRLASSIHDGVRYTFVFDTDGYVNGLDTAKAALANEGFKLRLLRPSWDDPDYKGVNSRWLDAKNEVLFEVQFHTQESWEAKQATHDVYEKLADPRTTAEQRAQLEEEQRRISASVPIPPGATDIDYYNAKDADE